MLKKLWERILSVITAATIVLALPASVFVSADDFVPENVLQTKLQSAQGILQTVSDGSVVYNTRFNENGAIAASTNGNQTVHADVYGALDWDPARYVGVEYTLSETVYAGYAMLYTGFDALPETWNVYAAAELDALYTDASLVGNAVNCGDQGIRVTINANVRYLAFICTAYSGNMRVKEFEMWTAEASSSEETTPENVLSAHVEDASGILYEVSTGIVSANVKFNENGAIAAATDGNNTSHADVYGWDSDHLVGVLYTLDAPYYCSNAVIYSGIDGYPDSYTVYASDNPDDLYLESSRVAHQLEVSATASTEVAVDRTVRYIAFLLTSDGGRVRELELFTGDDPNPPFVSENALKTKLQSSAGVDMFVSTGETVSSTRFDGNGALAAAVDGNKESHTDVYGALDWDPPRYVGAVYTLSEAVYAGEVKIYSGYDSMQDTYRVYASDTLSDLYNTSNMVSDDIVCGDEAVTLSVNKTVRYIAFFCKDFELYNIRVKEFELWTAEKPDDSDPEPQDPDPQDPDPQDPDPQDPEPQDPQPTLNQNFIRRHFDSSAGVMQDVKSGDFSDGDRFTQGNDKALSLAIDGDKKTFFDVYGALDWEYPKNVGARYQLNGVYAVKSAQIIAGDSARTVKITVYASDSVGTLFKEENRLQTVSCKGKTVTVKVGKEISAIAFIIVGYDMSSCATVAEFDLVGNDTPVKRKVFSWPKAPAGQNLLTSAKPSEIIAPGGDFLSAKDYDYRFMDGNDETSLAKLTDGDLSHHYDIWSLTPTDKPGVLYDLGAYYDLTHLHAFAGAAGSELITNFGYRIYASSSLETLFKTASLVASYSNEEDTTNEFAQNVDLSRVRYIAFFLTASSDGAWRMREFAAYGKKSADQSEPPVQTSIIEELEAEYYGVATKNLADPIYMGASDYVIALTDGKRDAVEFWGGSDVENSKFVFIYNLYANYDLSGVEVYSFADNIEEDSGIHKGIRSAKVYASRKLDKLFTSDPIVLKDDYDDPKTADENAFYESEAKSEWKGVRYIAYVFTIGDSRYGACRLEELRAFGTESAVQDKEEEEAVLPEYIDLKDDSGVVLRIYALDKKDDLSKLDATLSVESATEGKELDFVQEHLTDYKAETLYRVQLLSKSGSPLKTDGRLMRLSIPTKDGGLSVACIDDYNAEIVATGLLNNCLTVETETLRSYALVKALKSTNSSAFANFPLIQVAIITLGVLAGVGIVFSALAIVWIRKK